MVMAMAVVMGVAKIMPSKVSRVELQIVRTRMAVYVVAQAIELLLPSNGFLIGLAGSVLWLNFASKSKRC